MLDINDVTGYIVIQSSNEGRTVKWKKAAERLLHGVEVIKGRN